VFESLTPRDPTEYLPSLSFSLPSSNKVREKKSITPPLNLSTELVISAGPLANCHGVEISYGIISYFAMACTTYLFLQRIRTLYAGNQRITTIFTVLWLLCLGATTPAAFGIKMAFIPGTRYCVASNAERYVATAAFVRFAFDTLVYLAVAYHRVCVENSSPKNSTNEREKSVSGSARSGVYGAFLRGGQQYYL
jgi:hypothetical protein